jgi:ribosomal protein S10
MLIKKQLKRISNSEMQVPIIWIMHSSLQEIRRFNFTFLEKKQIKKKENLSKYQKDSVWGNRFARTFLGKCPFLTNHTFSYEVREKVESVKTRIKNHKNLRPGLKITFKSYGISQINDIKLSINIVAKLINYLNYFCTKQEGDSMYSKKQMTVFPYLDALDLVNTHSYPSIPLPGNFFAKITKEAKELAIPVELGLRQASNRSYRLKLELLENKYLNRYFFKWCQIFASYASMYRQIQKAPQRSQLFTVIRSPFVFKKTREQFSLQKQSYFVIVKLQNPTQKQFLIQCLGSLRLPAELEILDC